MQPLVRRTWAPKGKTPFIFQSARSLKKVSTIGALAAKPKISKTRFFFRLHANTNIKAGDCKAFLEQLSLSIRGNIFILWDNLKCHKSKKMYNYIDSQPRLSCFYFPPYAPELNPVEYVWSYLKSSPLSNLTPKDFGELSKKSKSSFHRLKYKPRLLNSFIKHSPIPFFD